MKIKVLSLALMLSVAAVLGACDAGTETSPGGNTTPAEPADGAGTTPAGTPAATPATTP